MNMRLQTAVALALVGLSAFAFSPRAEACGLNLVRSANGHWTVVLPAQAPAQPLSKLKFLASIPQSATPARPNPLQFLAPIAGLYEVTMTAEGNGPTGFKDGFQVDHAYVQWHADGTEIMNSGRPAGDGNFCLGTWAQTGPRTYTLNHFMLSYGQQVDRDGVTIDNTDAMPANIHETVTLSQDGQSYTGTFVLVQYDTNYNIILPGGIPVKGVVNGTRKTINSPVTY